MKLKKDKFIRLPLGSIKAKGWLQRQLETQKNGLTGHLSDFWDDIKDSGWIGGKSESWERAPYWLDGYIPLAFLLDDENMISISHFWIDEILKRQEESGWFGPRGDLKYGYIYDPWPNFVLSKVLIQYFEATNDTRIIPALVRFCQFLHKDLEQRILRSWGRFRWADMAINIIWLYQKTEESFLLELLDILYKQGFDWQEEMQFMPYREKIVFPEMTLANHVVNCAMGIKTPAVASRFHATSDALGTQFIIDQLDKYHGQATGAFSGDEHLAGKDPSQGYELCAVVEYMFSLEIAGAITGSSQLFDRLESLAFNALPATISADMWTHQYDQQVNQTRCAVATDNPWTTNGIDSNTFGFAPNFACCTANMHQGWPKFVSSMIMKTEDEKGLAITSYGPCSMVTEIDSKPVSLSVITKYPFHGDIQIEIDTAEEHSFPIQLRIPQWAEQYTIAIDGIKSKIKPKDGFITLLQPWCKNKISILFEFDLKSEIRFNKSRSFYYGPLLMALYIEGEWRQIKKYSIVKDYEVYPKTDWNYAIEIDQMGLPKSYEIHSQSFDYLIFNPEHPPVYIITQGRKIPEWQEHGLYATPPQSFEAEIQSSPIRLVPYGATDLRLGEIPIIQE